MKIEFLDKQENPAMTADGMRIELDCVDFSYFELQILHGISLDLKEGNLVSIIGPNGVGKSTLIHCINKILTPTGGTVSINGVDNAEISFKDLAKLLGYVPYTSPNTFPISVTDAVLMGRHPHNRQAPTDDDLRIVFQTLEDMGIDELADRQLNELSAGQLQKVILARGLAQEPRALLLDEPTANLDIKHQMGVTRMLRDISHSTGMLVIMICHDLNIAAKYSDWIIMMSEGRIYSEGDPVDTITEQAISDVYGVHCKVLIDCGRPHIILRDHDDPSNRLHPDCLT